MAREYDAIIVGGGHNGLVCGNYLARAGLKPLVLEARYVIGGAAATEEVFPDYHVSVFSYVMSLLAPKIIQELELEKYGYQVYPANDMFCPLPDDDYIIFSDNVATTQAQIARFSQKDAKAYPAFNAALNDAASVVRQLLWETPIDPTRRDWKSIKEMAQFFWRYRKVRGQIYRIADLLTQSVYHFLSQWFESDTVKSVLAYYASIGTAAGPKSPGSAYVLLHHVMGEHEGAGGWGFVRGGMGAISKAIAASGAAFGLEVKTNSRVANVLVNNGCAYGVATEDGHEYRAKRIISNVSCKLLFQHLVAGEHLPDDFLTEIDNYRTFSTAYKLNIACDAPPRYTAFDEKQAGFKYPSYVHIGPSINYLEHAYDEAKYGWYSSWPFATPVVPTIMDDTLAPPGKHIVNIFGGHAPYELKNGNWDQERERFYQNIIRVIDEFAPGFSSQIIDSQLLLPPDLEETLALPQGHIFHGELLADQLFFQRPAPHYADYRSPIRGLYQCGSSTHPGGGVSGIPGHNAAREILKDKN